MFLNKRRLTWFWYSEVLEYPTLDPHIPQFVYVVVPGFGWQQPHPGPERMAPGLGETLVKY